MSSYTKKHSAGKKLVAYVRITRPVVKWLLPILAVTSGAIMALGRLPVGGEWTLLLIAILIFGPLVQGVSIRSVNDLFDYEVDKKNRKNDQFRDFRPLVDGVLTKHEVATFAFFGHVLAVLGAFLLLNKTAGTILTLTLVGSWAYSVPPLRLRNTFWTQNALIGLFYCVGFHLAGWSLFRSWQAAPFQIYPWLFMAGFFGSIAKDFSDVEADKAKGVKTLPVLIGPETAARIFKIFYSLIYLFVGLTSYLSGFPSNATIISFLFFIPSYFVGREIEKSWRERGQFLMSVAIVLYLFWLILFSLAYIRVI